MSGELVIHGASISEPAVNVNRKITIKLVIIVNLRMIMILYFWSRSIFQPSAENLPGTFRGTFRKNLPRNLPQKPSAEPSAIKKIDLDQKRKITFRGAFRKNLPQEPSAKKKINFEHTFLKNLPRNLPQKPSARNFHQKKIQF